MEPLWRELSGVLITAKELITGNLGGILSLALRWRSLSSLVGVRERHNGRE